MGANRIISDYKFMDLWKELFVMYCDIFYSKTSPRASRTPLKTSVRWLVSRHKGKLRPRRGHEGPEVEKRYSSIISVCICVCVCVRAIGVSVCMGAWVWV